MGSSNAFHVFLNLKTNRFCSSQINSFYFEDQDLTFQKKGFDQQNYNISLLVLYLEIGYQLQYISNEICQKQQVSQRML
ncbi:hypothetical protein pb186bvf_002146 [Paramecium bursaria]